MATTTVLNEEQLEIVTPDENLMFDRLGFDRRTLRDEFAGRTSIEPGTEYVQQGNARYIHPDSDMPHGPSARGEVLGNIDLVQETGTRITIPRYTHGFTYQTEDGEPNVDMNILQSYRQGIAELFDLQADVAFFNGLQDEAGNDVFKGVFQWIDDNIDDNNIVNANDYDPSSGDLQGVPANIIKQVAFKQVGGRYVTAQWDLAVAKPEVWADWNQLGTFDGSGLRSQWDVVQADPDSENVGVNRRILLPHNIGLQAPANLDEDLNFSIDFPSRTNSTYSSPFATDGNSDTSASDDAMYLIPEHNGDFYELYEEPSPERRGPIEKEGFRERVEYKWRGGVVQGLSYRAEGKAFDAVKIENVTALFD